jgi:hypothetical protein
MSLIPSESYSFPDHFTSTVTPSRRPKHEKPQPEKIRKQPQIVALPDPEPEPAVAAEPAFEPEVMSEIWEPEVPVVKPPPSAPIMSEIWEPDVPVVKAPPPARMPNPAARRAHAPPPRIPQAPIRKIALPPSLKPKVRWNNRAPATDPSGNRHNGNGNGNGTTEVPTAPLPPAQNVIPMKAARPAPAPRPLQAAPPRPVMPQAPVQALPPRKPAPAPAQMRPVQPRPASAPPKAAPPRVSNSQADFFEVFAENSYEIASKRRREMKFRRFLACEGAALLVLLPLVILGLTLNISAPLRFIMNILTIVAAIAAVVIPIIFYAATPTLPELER